MRKFLSSSIKPRSWKSINNLRRTYGQNHGLVASATNNSQKRGHHTLNDRYENKDSLSDKCEQSDKEVIVDYNLLNKTSKYFVNLEVGEIKKIFEKDEYSHLLYFKKLKKACQQFIKEESKTEELEKRKNLLSNMIDDKNCLSILVGVRNWTENNIRILEDLIKNSDVLYDDKNNRDWLITGIVPKDHPLRQILMFWDHTPKKTFGDLDTFLKNFKGANYREACLNQILVDYNCCVSCSLKRATLISELYKSLQRDIQFEKMRLFELVEIKPFDFFALLGNGPLASSLNSVHKGLNLVKGIDDVKDTHDCRDLPSHVLDKFELLPDAQKSGISVQTIFKILKGIYCDYDSNHKTKSRENNTPQYEVNLGWHNYVAQVLRDRGTRLRWAADTL